MTLGFPGGVVVKNQSANTRDARDAGLIPGSERSPGIGNGNPLWYSYWENVMYKGAWWVRVHSVTELDTTEHACFFKKMMTTI